MGTRGIFSHPRVTKFWGDTPKNGTTPKLKFSKSTDFDIQINYIGVIDHAESKSGLVFELGLLLHYDFGFFLSKIEKKRKTSGSYSQSNTPLV